MDFHVASYEHLCGCSRDECPTDPLFLGIQEREHAVQQEEAQAEVFDSPCDNPDQSPDPEYILPDDSPCDIPDQSADPEYILPDDSPCDIPDQSPDPEYILPDDPPGTVLRPGDSACSTQTMGNSPTASASGGITADTATHCGGGETHQLAGGVGNCSVRFPDDHDGYALPKWDFVLPVVTTNRRFQFGNDSGPSSGKRGIPSRIKAYGTGEKPFTCKVCHASFSRMKLLSAHKRTHQEESLYKCEVCDRSFRSDTARREHNRLHTGERPYKCGVCDKSFARYQSVVVHCRMHTGEKPYKCRICDKSFAMSCNRNEHSRVHTGEKPYKCKVCDKAFSYKQHVKRHSRVHTKGKLYKCEVCDAAFSTKISRKRHRCCWDPNTLRYRCKVCEKAYLRKAGLTKHSRVHLK